MKSKLLTALLSLTVALGLWLYVVTVVSPNSDKTFQNIPVVMQSEVLLQDRGLMVTATDTETVALHVEGSRIDLNKLSSSNIIVTVDVSRIYEPGTHNLTYTHIFPGDVASNAIAVLSKSPGTIAVTVEERISKDVPVEIQYTGSLAEHYMADRESKELSAELVNVTGPKSVVDRIAAARIDVDLENRNESFSEEYEYLLCDMDGNPVDARQVTTNVEKVILTLKIMRVKELPVTVDIVYGGGATEETATVTVDPISIWVSGSDNILEGLDNLSLGIVDLSEILQDQELTFPIKLPEGVTNESDMTVTEAKVDVKFHGLSTKTVTLKEGFQVINVPAGMTAELLTKAMEVQIRGPEGILDAIGADNFTVIVDLSGAQAGTSKLKVSIVSNVPEVGAVGPYTVSVTLRQESGG